MIVSYYSKEEWAAYSANAHLSVFKEIHDANQDRIDFALLAADENQTLILYCTFCELDRDSVYMQFGGSFPPYRGSPETYRGFCEFVSRLSKQYKHLYFHVEHSNFAMLKFAIKMECKIVGVSRARTGRILLEHHLELNSV